MARAAAAWLAATRTAVRPVATQAGWIDAFVKASTVYEPSLSAIFVPQNCGWRGDHELDTETQRKCESAEAQGKGERSNAVGLSYWRALVLASLLLERSVKTLVLCVHFFNEGRGRRRSRHTNALSRDYCGERAAALGKCQCDQAHMRKQEKRLLLQAEHHLSTPLVQRVARAVGAAVWWRAPRRSPGLLHK